MRIGAGWQKVDKNEKLYISISIEKELKPLIIDDTKALALFINTNKEKSEQPDYILCMDVKKPKEETQKEGNETDFLF